MKKNRIEKLAKPFTLIFMMIVLCAILTHFFTGSETLAEYAAKNPEQAYPKEETDSTTIPTQESISVQNKVEADSSSEQAAPHINSKEETVNDNDNRNEDNEMILHPDRIEYKQGFYYEPLSDEIIKRITCISYPSPADNPEPAIGYDELRYVSLLYYNFKGNERSGELICNKEIAQDLVEIFYELYRSQYQIEQIRLIDEYSGDDTLSMQDNNTSCFNYRVVDGTTNLSKHALGLAIDINPFFNPYVVYQADGSTYISPQGSETYADRSKDFAYKIDENDLCYKLFKEHGFIWGGDWNSCKDYQHFQKTLD